MTSSLLQATALFFDVPVREAVAEDQRTAGKTTSDGS
jgi:hypothetical protein